MALRRVLSKGWVTPAGWGRPLCQAVDVTLVEHPVDEDLLEQKRDKSRLAEHHYKKLHGQVTRLSEDEEIVVPLSLQRRLYAQHGADSGINVGKLWPSKEELELEREWEKVARPHSVQEMIAMAKKAREDEERATKERQEDLKKKVAKLEGWKRDVQERVKQQEREAQIAKEKKEKLIEEVRQILGFQIHPKDDRFKEALLQKEKEEKKAKKAAKKLAQQQRMIDRLRMEAQPPVAPAQDTTSKSETKGEGSGISSGSAIV